MVPEWSPEATLVELVMHSCNLFDSLLPPTYKEKGNYYYRVTRRTRSCSLLFGKRKKKRSSLYIWHITVTVASASTNRNCFPHSRLASYLPCAHHVISHTVCFQRNAPLLSKSGSIRVTWLTPRGHCFSIVHDGLGLRSTQTPTCGSFFVSPRSH